MVDKTSEPDWDRIDRIESDLKSEIRWFIDRHPVLQLLPEVDKRNAAHCGASDAMSSIRGAEMTKAMEAVHA